MGINQNIIINKLMLLFIKSLFVPKNNFVDTNINSIKSFITYFKTINQKFKQIYIKIVGWIGPIDNFERDRLIEYIDYEKNILSTYNSNIVLDIEVWNSNFGKCFVFQNIKSIFQDINDYDYILYADHDISPIDDIIKERFLVGSTLVTKKYGNKEIAIMSFLQEPDSRHNETIFVNKTEFNGQSYFYHKDNIRIATGCFITTPKIFNLLSRVKISRLNTYKIYEGIYGEEDIAIGKILNTHNYFHVVSSLRVNHPYFIDYKYTKWKESQIMKIALNQLIGLTD
jgi:hypothetical protein